MAEKEKHTENKVTLSWLPFWFAGFMFSMGAGALPAVPLAAGWGQQLVALFLLWFLWPLFLGMHIAG